MIYWILDVYYWKLTQISWNFTQDWFKADGIRLRTGAGLIFKVEDLRFIESTQGMSSLQVLGSNANLSSDSQQLQRLDTSLTKFLPSISYACILCALAWYTFLSVLDLVYHWLPWSHNAPWNSSSLRYRVPTSCWKF